MEHCIRQFYRIFICTLSIAIAPLKCHVYYLCTFSFTLICKTHLRNIYVIFKIKYWNSSIFSEISVPLRDLFQVIQFGRFYFSYCRMIPLFVQTVKRNYFSDISWSFLSCFMEIVKAGSLSYIEFIFITSVAKVDSLHSVNVL